MPPTNLLRPIILNNASSLRITATAGTKLVGISSLFNVYIHQQRKNFTTELLKIITLFCLLHSRNITGSGFRLLSKIPHCRLKA